VRRGRPRGREEEEELYRACGGERNQTRESHCLTLRGGNPCQGFRGRREEKTGKLAEEKKKKKRAIVIWIEPIQFQKEAGLRIRIG